MDKQYTLEKVNRAINDLEWAKEILKADTIESDRMEYLQHFLESATDNAKLALEDSKKQ